MGQRALSLPVATRRRISMRQREALMGYVYLSPWVLGFVVFVGGPIVVSFLLSMTQYDILSTPQVIWLANYKRALMEDKLFWPSLLRTLYYAAVVVPLGTLGSLILAVVLNQEYPANNLLRTFYFLPSLTPAVAAAILWKWILQPEIGLMNYMLSWVGIKGPLWMGSTEWAVPALMLIAIWQGMGGNRMMIFLAGLKGVPQELYEAAEIDGATAWHRLWHITVPMISPTIFFNAVLGVIGALQVFAVAYVATQGGPVYATWFFALHIYYSAFQFFEMGYACALAWIFFVILFVFTYVQFRLSSRWVYYAGEAK